MTIIEDRIATVTVYLDRARVTRVAQVHLASGEHILTLANLPFTLDENSVRASGKGAGVAHAKILGIDVAKTFVARAPEKSIAELEQQLEALQEQDRAFADEETAAAAHIDFLQTLRDATGRSLAKGLAFGNASLDRVQQFSDYAARELTAAQTRQRDVAQKRRAQKRKIDAAQARLAQAQQGMPNERYQIHVKVDAATETDFELQVTYAVAPARWTPLYDLRLQGTQVALDYLGEVAQTTGEDWQSVELFLSTARLAASIEMPELAPWYIDTYRPMPKIARAAMPQAMMTGAPPPPASEAMAEDVMMMPALVEASGAAVTYRVLRPVTIPSDGAPHKTGIATLELAAQLDYLTAPKIAEEAYLRAKIKNTSEFTLLAGRANIFHGNDFVGATELKTTTPNQDFEVHLGVDERIQVKRELIERSVDKSLMGNTRRILFGYKITLINALPTNAKITVLDQLPVPRSEEIKVKPRDASPKPNEQSDLQIWKWELDCRPQEKREIVFGFSVEHPRDAQLSGIID